MPATAAQIMLDAKDIGPDVAGARVVEVVGVVDGAGGLVGKLGEAVEQQNHDNAACRFQRVRWNHMSLVGCP